MAKHSFYWSYSTRGGSLAISSVVRAFREVMLRPPEKIIPKTLSRPSPAQLLQVLPPRATAVCQINAIQISTIITCITSHILRVISKISQDGKSPCASFSALFHRLPVIRQSKSTRGPGNATSCFNLRHFTNYRQRRLRTTHYLVPSRMHYELATSLLLTTTDSNHAPAHVHSFPRGLKRGTISYRRYRRITDTGLKNDLAGSRCDSGVTSVARQDEVLTKYLQVLAVDLLNPSPAAEAKKHKLKVNLSSALVVMIYSD